MLKLRSSIVIVLAHARTVGVLATNQNAIP
jgi:hypothetical protein